MFGMNFGRKAAAAQEKMAQNHTEDLQKFNEGGTETKEVKHSPAWKKFLVLFAAGVLTMESVSAATSQMTPEEAKIAAEFMKGSPERVQGLENQLIALAESQPMVSEGVENGHERSHKNFKIDDQTAVWIEYDKADHPDSTAHPVSLSVRTVDAKSGNKIIISDGLKADASNKSNENFDGRVDRINIIEPAKYGKDANGNKIVIAPEHRITYGFTESRGSNGETYVQLTGLKVSPGQEKVVLNNTQRAFEDALNNAANPSVAENK